MLWIDVRQHCAVGAMPKGRRRDWLAAALDGVLALFGACVLPFDTNAPRHSAELAVRARKAGRGFPTPDGYVAVVAAAAGSLGGTALGAVFSSFQVEVA